MDLKVNQRGRSEVIPDERSLKTQIKIWLKLVVVNQLRVQ